MTDQQQPRTAAKRDIDSVSVESTYVPDTTLHHLNGSHVVELKVSRAGGWVWLSPDDAYKLADTIHKAATLARHEYDLTSYDESEDDEPDLGAQIAELRDTVAELTSKFSNANDVIDRRLTALESPASAPDAHERLWTKVIDRMNSAASPATAHQEPPDAVLRDLATAYRTASEHDADGEVMHALRVAWRSHSSDRITEANELDKAIRAYGRDGAR